MQRTVLFIDYNNLSIRCLFGDTTMFNNPNPSFDQHKHILLATIFSNIKKFSPDEVIIAIDDRKNWRKLFYEDYKANRKDSRDKDIFPWEKYFGYINNFTNELKKIFPFKFIQIKYAEADDVIAILSRHLTETINIIVTTDTDYIQLLQEKNIKLYDPLKKKQIIDDNPTKTLQIKILSGCKSDNITSIKPRVGDKTAMKLIDSGELENLLKDDVIKKLYDRNRRLTDWHFIPEAIKMMTLSTYDKYPKINEFNTMEIMKFFVQNKLRKHLEDLSVIKQLIAPLMGEKTMKEYF